MELLSVIRRWRLREGVSIREISRRTKLSRNTIKRYLQDGMLEPKYPVRQSQGKLDGFVPTLEAWLAREATRSRMQRRNLRRLYTDLVALGYGGSYDRVAAHARRWRRRSQEASRGTFVPLLFAPGEAFQFDWSEDWAVIGGERCKVKGTSRTPIDFPREKSRITSPDRKIWLCPECDQALCGNSRIQQMFRPTPA